VLRAKYQIHSLTAKTINDFREESRTDVMGTTADEFGASLADRSEIRPMLSVVVPFYNEEGNVTELHARLHAALDKIGWPYELVFVDDGSSDGTNAQLRELAAVDPLVTVVRLRRNFGQTAALAAGFAQTSGEYVIAMDGDLQHDPAEIPVFLSKLAEGYDVVSGWRVRRLDNLWMRRIPSRCANWLMAKFSGVDIHDFGTTFKAYRGDLLRQLPLYGEMHRFIPAIASAYGASICEVPIHISNRTRGVSNYNISRTFRVMFDLMTIWFLLRFMSRPSHFFGRLGIVNTAVGSLMAFWLLIKKVVYGTAVVQDHGALTVFAAVLILAGLHMLALGLLSELSVWHYFNPSGRSPYSISDVVHVREFGHASQA
jgi:glycosyltransferase involved in cell wall biosynthesis